MMKFFVTRMTMQNFRFGLVLVHGPNLVWDDPVDQIDPNPNYKPIGLSAVRRSLAVRIDFLLEGEGVDHF